MDLPRHTQSPKAVIQTVIQTDIFFAHVSTHVLGSKERLFVGSTRPLVQGALRRKSSLTTIRKFGLKKGLLLVINALLTWATSPSRLMM